MRFFLLLMCIGIVNGNDPCTNHKTINDWQRSVANDDSSSSLCDSFLVDGWYKGVSGAGNELPTECPEGGFRCGTARPIWMNGTYPNAGIISNITACAADYTMCCSKSYNIQVKNCSGFYVYYLRKTNGCAQAYCIGKELPCPTGYTSKNGFSPGCKYEPCLRTNHKEINNWERSVKNNNTDAMICDSYLKPGWFRPTSKAGNLMPNKCLNDGFTCGTAKPIWMNGNFPMEGEISNVTACASSYHNCCAHSYDIQVKNCTSFNVYNLVPTYGCAQAYCFGSEIPCHVGYSSDTGFTPGCSFDSCNKVNFKIMKGQTKRSSNYTVKAYDTPIDDSTLQEGWYKINSESGNDIVTTPQIIGRCGTTYPIWMKGVLPEVLDKTVNRTVCITDTNGNCKAEFNIQVRNCGSFRTYFLPRVNVRFAAYCFGTLPVVLVSSGGEKHSSITCMEYSHNQARDNHDKIWAPVVGVFGAVIIVLVGYLVKKQIVKGASVSKANSPVQPPPPYSPPDARTKMFTVSGDKSGMIQAHVTVEQPYGKKV